MQPSLRQQELERLYNSRKGHVPQISISDDNYHVTEALGSYYEDESPAPLSPSADKRDQRPLSFVPASAESIENRQQQLQARKSRRNGSYFETNRSSPPRTPLGAAQPNEKLPSPTTEAENITTVKRASSMGSEHGGGSEPQSPIVTTPPLNRRPSADTAIQQFPLNDIDYESSPAAVAQELSNLQAIRRMSMNVDAADPDLPSFGAGGMVPTVAPKGSEDENDTARLFWVPARLHPELAPKEFKTFIEDRVDKIRRRSGDAETLSPEGLERSGSSSSLRRKKSMLSHQIDTKGNYEDGAERLERKRSKGMSLESNTRVDLSELESLVSDPAQLIRRMSLDTSRRSLDSGVEMPPNDDISILPQVSQSLKRSTRTTYRKGSLKKGERVPLGKRAQHRHAGSDVDEPISPRTSFQEVEEPISGLTRVQTEPSPLPPPSQSPLRDDFPPRQSSRRQAEPESPRPSDEISQERVSHEEKIQRRSPRASSDDGERPPPPRPQHRQFQSRLASGTGRTTAQLPGYNNTNPLPNIIETLPDGSKVPTSSLIQQIDERRASLDAPSRKRSTEFGRPFHRGGAHMRPIGGRDHQRSSTLDDLSSHPNLLPGSGGMGTDSLTIVPTFDDRKIEKKDSSRKSSWKWVFGSDDDEKRAAKEDRSSESSSIRSLKAMGLNINKQSAEKIRPDVQPTTVDTGAPSRGRESLVLNREDIKIDDDRKRDGKKSSETNKDRGRDSGLLSAIFGGKKRSAESDTKEKKRASKADHSLSPAPAPRILKPDIDYNWTRFSILEERAIYRMAHIKLANPRRALYSQVLLSNFMYSYLAKVQLMHPQVQIPAAHQRSQQRGQQRQDDQPAEYSQYQRWQQQQEREEAAISNGTGYSNSQPDSNIDHHSSGEYDDENLSGGGHDPRSSSEDYDYDTQQATQSSSQQAYYSTSPSGGSASQYRESNGSQRASAGVKGGGESAGYSATAPHDYLGYPADERPFSSQGGLWDDEDDEGKDAGEDSLW